jgi:NitT/TauT family transport system ATP-binding protein/taurine transport system ATP-binding protein
VTVNSTNGLRADLTTEVGAEVGPGVGVGVALAGVTVVYGERRARREALAPVDLDIAPGELLTILGPSGCGKSTLLGLVAGFLRPSSGAVTVDGRLVTGPGADRGVVFQQPRLFPWMSVRRNVEFGPRMAGAGGAERRQTADEALALVGLSDVADRAPYELSGGMQQRAAIARALGGRPSVLLMDEPFAALDALTRERLQDELLRLWATTGTTVLFVTHSVEEAAYLGTRVVTLSARPGRVIADRPLPRTRAATTQTGLQRDDPALVAERETLRRLVHDAAG